MSSAPKREVFQFHPPAGVDPGHIELEGVISGGYTSPAGKRVMRFPPPFDDLEITDGERIGHGKWLKIRKAVAALRERM